LHSEIIQIVAIIVILLGIIGFAKVAIITLCKKLKSVHFKVNFSNKGKSDQL
jgi:hypothetical protein